MASNHALALQFYKDHQDELVAKYNGKTLILKDDQILEVKNTLAEAYDFAVEKFGRGNFSLQEVSPGVDSYTASFASPRTAIY